MRLRLPLRFGPVPPRGKAPQWEGTARTAWLDHEIRPYPAHAENLDPKGELGKTYARILAMYWATMMTAMNRGPFNPGPPNARGWSRITSKYESLLATKGLSDAIRARALLGLAYSSIEEATLTRANLFESSFEKADLTGARLDGANAYGAEFFRATIDGMSRAGANLKATKLGGD